jgi:hypothetical protein
MKLVRKVCFPGEQGRHVGSRLKTAVRFAIVGGELTGGKLAISIRKDSEVYPMIGALLNYEAQE